MKEKIIDTFILLLFILAVVFIVITMTSIILSAYHLGGIHHELQILNDTLSLMHYD